MTQTPLALPRRAVLGAGLVLPFLPSLAAAAPKALSFAVFRNGTRIGDHHVTFSGDGESLVATAEAILTVKLGPVPVFKYKHHAVEKRVGGDFVSLVTSTDSNGKAEKVSAEKEGGVVRISCPTGDVTAPANINPITHWNPASFSGPLFNPQNGKLLKAKATKAGAGHWQVRGDTEIDDYYDDAGAWQALKGKLNDGSMIEYRRT
jgi:hypothetical protein